MAIYRGTRTERTGTKTGFGGRVIAPERDKGREAMQETELKQQRAQSPRVTWGSMVSTLH